MTRWMPHGACVQWNGPLLAVSVISDLIIALAYFSIATAFVLIARRYPKFRAAPVVYMTAAFIYSCGGTHVMSVITTFHPSYWMEATVSAFTALASIATAVVVWIVSPLLEDLLPHGKKSGNGQ